MSVIIFSAGNPATNLDVSADRIAYLVGLVLGANFNGDDYSVTSNGNMVNVDMSIVGKVVDPENLSFTEGFRFCLVNEDGIEAYWTKSNDVWGGCIDYAIKILKISPLEFVTDIVRYDYAPGGSPVIYTSPDEKSKNCIITIPEVDKPGARFLASYTVEKDRRLQLYVDASSNIGVKYAESSTRRGQTKTVITSPTSGTQYLSVADGKLVDYYENPEFLDQLNDLQPKSVVDFLTSLLLTRLAGSPPQISLSASGEEQESIIISTEKSSVEMSQAELLSVNLAYCTRALLSLSR